MLRDILKDMKVNVIKYGNDMSKTFPNADNKSIQSYLFEGLNPKGANYIREYKNDFSKSII